MRPRHTVEYRLKEGTNSRKKDFFEGQRDAVITVEPNKIYQLRDVTYSGCWQECRADSNGKIALMITADLGAQCVGC